MDFKLINSIFIVGFLKMEVSWGGDRQYVTNEKTFSIFNCYIHMRKVSGVVPCLSTHRAVDHTVAIYIFIRFVFLAMLTRFTAIQHKWL